MRVEGGGSAAHRHNDLNITADDDKPNRDDLRAQADDFASRLTQFGDWGNPCFTACTSPLRTGRFMRSSALVAGFWWLVGTRSELNANGRHAR